MWAGDVENAMKIKKIEITGFKSFCDRMVLEIEDPITAVVGPNGCGKSNIVDAIRWAMGEQSAKHLRGKSMDDVIFNGSESRGPAAYAEVTITFGNVGLGSQKSELDIELEAALAADDEADAALGEAAAAEGAAPAPGTEPVVIASEPVETPIDYSQYGGAPLLGVKGNSIICHGSSNANAILNAIRVAVQAAEIDLSQHIGAEFASHAGTA